MAYIIFNVARISDSIDRCIKLTNNRLISTTVKKLQNINKDLDTLSFQNVCNTSYTIPSGLSYSVNGITFSIPSTEIPGNSTINVPVKLSGTPVNEGVFNGEINVLGNVVNLRAIVEGYTQEECITYPSVSPSTTITRNIERGVNLPKTEIGFVSVENSCPVSFTIPGREFINEDGFRVYTETVTVGASQNVNIPIYAEGTYNGVKPVLEGSQSFGGTVVTVRVNVTETCVTCMSERDNKDISLTYGAVYNRTQVGTIRYFNKCQITSKEVAGEQLYSENGVRLFTETVSLTAGQSLDIPIYATGTVNGTRLGQFSKVNACNDGRSVVVFNIRISSKPTATGDIVKEANNRVNQRLELSDFNGKWSDANGDSLEAIKILPAVGETYLKPNLYVPIRLNPDAEDDHELIGNNVSEILIESSRFTDYFPMKYRAEDTDSVSESRYRFQVKAGGEWSDL